MSNLKKSWQIESAAGVKMGIYDGACAEEAVEAMWKDYSTPEDQQVFDGIKATVVFASESTIINVVIVLADARPISFQAESWREAVERALKNAEGESIERVFMHEPGNSSGCEEHTVESLRRDVEMGNVPR